MKQSTPCRVGIGVSGRSASRFTCFAARAADDDNMRLLPPPHGELPPSCWEQHGWLDVAGGLAALIVVACVRIAWLSGARKPPVITPPRRLARRDSGGPARPPGRRRVCW